MIWRKIQWPLIALGLVMLFNLLFTKNFFELEVRDGRLYGSIIDILNRGTPVMLLSLGMTLVIATGGVDLSVGAVMAITGAIAALQLNAGHSVPMVMAVSLGAALAAGVWNGMLVGYFKVPPIIATLILMVSGRGIAQLMTDGQIITFDNPAFEYIGRGAFLGLPFTITLTLVVFGLLLFLQRRTAMGLFIEATGDNEVASRYAGVNTRFVKLLVYALCSLWAGLAGLIVATNIKAADSNNAGLWLELDAILAAVVGGTALQGGRFFLGSSLIAAILIQSITTTVLTRDVNFNVTLVLKALVIVAICLVQAEAFQKHFRRRRPVTA
jgi:ribose/xylose/arabinose/galactoside ABC-type transport system permease subunit